MSTISKTQKEFMAAVNEYCEENPIPSYWEAYNVPYPRNNLIDKTIRKLHYLNSIEDKSEYSHLRIYNKILKIEADRFSDLMRSLITYDNYNDPSNLSKGMEYAYGCVYGWISDDPAICEGIPSQLSIVSLLDVTEVTLILSKGGYLKKIVQEIFKRMIGMETVKSKDISINTLYSLNRISEDSAKAALDILGKVTVEVFSTYIRGLSKRATDNAYADISDIVLDIKNNSGLAISKGRAGKCGISNVDDLPLTTSEDVLNIIGESRYRNKGPSPIEKYEDYLQWSPSVIRFMCNYLDGRRVFIDLNHTTEEKKHMAELILNDRH